jgi:hypothetical protein
MEAAAHGSRLAHDWLSASLEVKQRSRGASFAGSRPGSARLHADGRSHFLSPRQEKWEDLEGDEVLVEEDEDDGDSICDLSSEDSAVERREREEALRAEEVGTPPAPARSRACLPAPPSLPPSFPPGAQGRICRRPAVCAQTCHRDSHERTRAHARTHACTNSQRCACL